MPKPYRSREQDREIDLEEAKQLVRNILDGTEQWIELFGSAFRTAEEQAEYAKHCRLAITTVEEHDFGWVIFYDVANFDWRWPGLSDLYGGGPYIVERATGRIYSTGTFEPPEEWIEMYRNDELRPIDIPKSK